VRSGSEAFSSLNSMLRPNLFLSSSIVASKV